MATSLTADEYNLISGLFVRVGNWISHCDDTDRSQKSEEKEKQEMVKALKRVERLSSSPVIADAAGAAVSRLPPQKETRETLTSDLRKAVQIFTSHDDQVALSQFRKALMYTGTSVARAYREELDHHTDEFMLETWLNKVVGALNEDADPADFKNTNVSPAEDSALTMISEALRQGLK